MERTKRPRSWARNALLGLCLTAVAGCSDDGATSTLGNGTGGPGGTGGAYGTGATGGGTGASLGGTGAAVGSGGSDGSGGLAAGATCPATVPMDGGACAGGGWDACVYDTASCRCQRGNWRCEAPPDPNCPAEAPMAGDACAVEGTSCTFRRRQRCSCTAGAWACDGADEDGGMPWMQ